MPNVWYAIPSKRPPEQAQPVLNLWRERGYKIALWCDEHEPKTWSDFFKLSNGHYPGYAVAVNQLVHEILERDPGAEWIVTGGDDVEPDPNHSAEEIAMECYWHFVGPPIPLDQPVPYDFDQIRQGTFGVMQPTGDRWGDNRGALIDRICGSPWMGREFCRRIYGGKGPLWPEFTHMFVDEHLQRVAQKLGILWQRPDLTHHHRHFMREPGTDRFAASFEIPEHLKDVTTTEHWQKSLAIFRRLEGNEFKEALDLLP